MQHQAIQKRTALSNGAVRFCLLTDQLASSLCLCIINLTGNRKRTAVKDGLSILSAKLNIILTIMYDYTAEFIVLRYHTNALTQNNNLSDI